MVRFTGGLLLFTALASAIPTNGDTHGQSQQLLHLEAQQQPPGNPRKLRGRFLHITDLHPDPFYKAGAEPGGNHPCHQGKGSDVSTIYGAATTDCDSPFALVNATFKWIKENIKDEIDFVVWTGDSARHDNDDDIPRSSKQIQDLNRYCVEKFIETFGKSDNIDDPDPTNDFVVPIVPTYGNNDILPHNIFSPGPNAWTRNFLDIWRNFIPEEQKHSFARGGWFWSEVIPNRLAVISLNTMYFFQSNSAVDGCNAKTEPGYEHMEWLRIQLQFMRERGVKAILIGHVPPARTESKQNWDETCYQKYVLWQRQYRDVIVANLFGHMNIDHFMFHDVKDLVYKFDVDGIADHLRSDSPDEYSASNPDFTALAKATYIAELRDGWTKLPKPPKGLTYESPDDSVQSEKKKKDKKKKKKKKKKDKEKLKSDFLKAIGGPYGERFSMTIVSPSVVPNYFPTLRIIEYNMTGLENDHPAMGIPQGHLATEKDLKDIQLLPVQVDDLNGDTLVTDNDDVSIEKKKKKKNKHKKKPKKQKPDFAVPAPPTKTSLPGPAYSPQTFSLLSWTQLYANLTSIHEQMAADLGLEAGADLELEKKKAGDYFKYQVEYVTNGSVYQFEDLTIPRWLGLAERMARTEFKHLTSSIIAVDAGPENEDRHDSAKVDEGIDRQGDVEASKKKKKKKHKKKKKKTRRLRDNKLWHEFVRRAFVHSIADKDLESDFD